MDLAYTLNLNRTRWGHRAFAIARDAQSSAAFDQSAVQSGVATPVAPRVGFLFTGQGVSTCVPNQPCEEPLTAPGRLNGQEWDR